MSKCIILLLILLLIIVLILLCCKSKANFQNSKNKKIVFLFLIYDKINHEELWYKYLENIDKNKYNIYIHHKENNPLTYFEKYKINNCIETKWGDVSVVMAQNILLEHALKDSNNKYFIWLSGDDIPLKPFNYIYDYLDTQKSYYNLGPISQIFPRFNNALKYLKRDNIKKAAMPSIICRKHAELFLKNNENIKLWFKNILNVDELAHISLLHHYGLQNELVLTDDLAAGAIINSSWPGMSNYKLFDNSKLIIKSSSPNNYIHICEEELNYLINSKSLFGRKFLENCTGLENLNKKLINFT